MKDQNEYEGMINEMVMNGKISHEESRIILMHSYFGENNERSKDRQVPAGE